MYICAEMVLSERRSHHRGYDGSARLSVARLKGESKF